MLLALAACQAFPSLQPTSLSQSTLTPAALTTPPQASPTVSDELTPTDASPESLTLRLWLPEQFDPSADTLAADILNTRLNAFMDQNPGIHIEVRLKALDGTGGLLESLTAAKTAAPLALPDLIALPRPLLESAALKGLLYPYDSLTEVMRDENWYDYARQLAYVQESVFGLPFAGDLQVLVYRPVAMDIPPRNWESAFAFGNPLAFSAADPKALFTINQYQAAGGTVWDNQGRPMLDEAVLTQVLTLYQKASQAGVMPVWVTQLETDQQVWQAFTDEQAPMAVSWASSYFNASDDLPFETMIAPPITQNGSVFTLATGWVWALSSPDVERRELAAQLAEFLVDVTFLAEWDDAAGFPPPHIDALGGWSDEAMRQLVGRISLTASLTPSEDLLVNLGPALEEAVVQVLKQQTDPLSAAENASARVNQP